MPVKIKMENNKRQIVVSGEEAETMQEILESDAKPNKKLQEAVDTAHENREKLVMNYLVEAWNAYVKLPQQHPDDIEEFRHGLHRLQHLMAVRHVRRADPENWPSETPE